MVKSELSTDGAPPLEDTGAIKQVGTVLLDARLLPMHLRSKQYESEPECSSLGCPQPLKIGGLPTAAAPFIPTNSKNPRAMCNTGGVP